MADTKGYVGDTRRIQGEADTRPHRHMAAEAWRGSQNGQMADKVWRGRRGQSELKADKHKADTGRTRLGGAAQRTQGGHIHGGQEHIAASRFLLRENPTLNCLGTETRQGRRRRTQQLMLGDKLYQHRPKQFFKHRERLQRPNLRNQNECQGT